jgi:hypothetical protein
MQPDVGRMHGVVDEIQGKNRIFHLTGFTRGAGGATWLGAPFPAVGKIVSRCAPTTSGFADTDFFGGVRTVDDNL